MAATCIIAMMARVRDGTSNLKVPAIDACLHYVNQGSWIEIYPHAVLNTYGDHW